MQSALRTDSASRHDAELADGYTWPTVDRVEPDLVEFGERAAHAIGLAMVQAEREEMRMQATKPIDEVVTGDRVMLDDGRPAVVRYNDAYVTRIGPSATMVMHRLVTVADDGSTVYVDARWRDPVSVIID